MKSQKPISVNDKGENTMKIILLIIISLMLFVSSCRDTRESFHFKDTKTNITYLVECDTACARCSTWTNGEWLIFDTNTNGAVYDKCIGLPAKRNSPPPSVKPPPTGIELVQFLPTNQNVWGWDGFRDDSKKYNSINHISLSIGGYAEFDVRINAGDKFYDRYICSINDDQTNSLSFVSTAKCVSCTLSVGRTTINIYARSNLTGSAKIKVVGESKGGIYCLAGPPVSCSGSQDELDVHVYKQRLITKCVLYLLNGTSYNPNQNVWKNMFNPILKQAVSSMDTVKKVMVKDSSWDYNNNGKLDMWAGETAGLIPINRIEAGKLLFNLSLDTSVNSLVVIPYIFRTNWLIMADASAGDSIICLHSNMDIDPGDLVVVSPWIGSVNNECIEVKGVLSQNKIKLKGPLQYNHNKNDIIYQTNSITGFSGEYFSCLRGLPHNQTVVHELLHQKKIADLKDVLDRDNIMFLALAQRTDTKLRYRAIDCKDGFSSQSQWDYINR